MCAEALIRTLLRMLEDRLSTRFPRLLPAALITLSLIPIGAGAMRLIQLGSHPQLTPDNARFVLSSALERPAAAYTGQWALPARYSRAPLSAPSTHASRVRR